MPQYSVSYLRRASKDLDKLDQKLVTQIVREIQKLKSEPRGINCKPLKGFKGMGRRFRRPGSPSCNGDRIVHHAEVITLKGQAIVSKTPRFYY